MVDISEGLNKYSIKYTGYDYGSMGVKSDL